jgi:hypothetical protein
MLKRGNPMQIRRVIIKVDDQDKALSFYTHAIGTMRRRAFFGRLLRLVLWAAYEPGTSCIF